MERKSVRAGGVLRPLGRALFLAVLIQCVSRTAQTTTAEPPTHTCESGTLEVPLTPLDLSVKLACSSGSAISEESGKAFAYVDGSCGSDAKPFSELLGSAAAATWSAHVLSLQKLPTADKQICYQCKRSEEVTCTVVINVPSAPKSCTPPAGLGRSFKESGEEQDLDLQVENNEPVFFTCPANYTLDPTDEHQAYVGTDQCGGNATQRADVQRKGKNNGPYSFQLAEKPKKEEMFCYKCTKSSRGTGEQCMIKIKTVTTTTTTASGSSTDDESTDSTASAAATLTYVTGVFCAAVMWLGSRF
ncbi:SRS domain-containing protein [Neospora caninum Liverpool]|uniref:SRS domain-containing protein n=1 Tax=Neospora caninum (strain Liverpool) TaxID=572307 RepID=F0VG86_NEOCL|nr:SRS domain-containing protein [Neospora caninum Liverpool]CBZ52730.1 SRS domain-containing protein [Neospora caninum Liverpool]CEL66711.1 TPA: SRS domain-containing protein [Neospora caninum Liverpool]|eukprot:XP_003882762.1 SRS domain-containing protein [Neospora caninum Liverpool]